MNLNTRQMSDRDLIAQLTQLSSHSPKAALILTALTDDTWFEAVSELRKRYSTKLVEEAPVAYAPVSESGRHPHAASVEIDPARFKAFFFRRRIPLAHVGPLFGRCSGWASVIAHKARAGYYALDELARELDMTADELIAQIGSDAERSRLQAIV